MRRAEGMGDSKDWGIKLFGTKIPFAECQIQIAPTPAKYELTDTCKMEGNPEHDSDKQEGFSCVADGENSSQNLVKLDDRPARSKSEDDSTQNNTADDEKAFKKPDKIRQCPRCNSLDTKFCYFNNYNVNQPRYFCKHCQRYWTDGGTMRNVPIGAGRRKNKHLASHFRQIIVSADGIPTGLEATDSDNQTVISGLQHSGFTSSSEKGTVLKFGLDPPALCESMETMLNLKDQKICLNVSSVNCSDSREETIHGSSLTTAGAQGTELPVHVTRGKQVVPKELITSNPLQCYPVPWNPSWNSSTSMDSAHHLSAVDGTPNNINPNSAGWYLTPVGAVPSIFPPNMSLQFLPGWHPGTEVISPGSNFSLSPTSSTSNSYSSGNGSPILGKHCRDTNFIADRSEKCVLVPKTLRMDDPNEASRSPIWSTLGIKPN